MINYADLARRLLGKNVKDDSLMPWSYQFPDVSMSLIKVK